MPERTHAHTQIHTLKERFRGAFAVVSKLWRVCLSFSFSRSLCFSLSLSLSQGRLAGATTAALFAVGALLLGIPSFPRTVSHKDETRAPTLHKRKTASHCDKTPRTNTQRTIQQPTHAKSKQHRPCSSRFVVVRVENLEKAKSGFSSPEPTF